MTILESVSSGLRTALMVADTLGLERSSECETLARSVTSPRLSMIFTMLFMLCCRCGIVVNALGFNSKVMS